MTIDELKADPRYLRLSPQQKVFVVAMCENKHDKIAAAKIAWNPSTERSASSFANRAFRLMGVKSLIGDFFGTDLDEERLTREDVLCMAARRARKAQKDGDAHKFLSLIAEMEGWLNSKKSDERPEDEEATELSALIRKVEQ